MTTTIQVKDLTKQRLEALKQRYKAASYDEVIVIATAKEFDTPKSMFGSLKGLKPWTKADRMRFKYE